EPMEKCSKFNPHISKELEKIIMKAMEVDKKDRYQKIEDMRAELARSSSAAGTGVKRPPLKPVFHRKEDEEEPPAEEVEEDSNYKPISFQMEHQTGSESYGTRQPAGIKGKSVLPQSSQRREQMPARSSDNTGESAQTRPFTARQNQPGPAGTGHPSQGKQGGNISQAPFQGKQGGKISQSPLQTKPFTRTPSEGIADRQTPRRRILEDRTGQTKTPSKSPVLPPLQQTPSRNEEPVVYGKRHIPAEEPSKITSKLKIDRTVEPEPEDLYDEPDYEIQEEISKPERNIKDLTRPQKHLYEEEMPQKKPGVIQRILKFLFRIKV
ncbi:MAG: hypothetical protein ABRQ39_25060, partial [Candidatus Eremiobacterota bacterium]